MQRRGTGAPGNPISGGLSSGARACSVDALATEPHPSYFLFPTRSGILLVGMYKLCSEIPGVCRNPLVGISPPLPLKVTRPRGVNVISTPECKSGERKLKDGELTCFVHNKVWPRQEDSSPEGEACSVQ